VLGRSLCTLEALDGPAIWRAVVRNGRLAEWRVYEDNEDARRTLGIVGDVLVRP
jgi:hypothetical protein